MKTIFLCLFAISLNSLFAQTYDSNPFSKNGMNSQELLDQGYARYQVASGYLRMDITNKKGKKKGEQIHYWDRWGLREARIEKDKKGEITSITYLDGEMQHMYTPETNSYMTIKNTFIKPVAKEMGEKDLTEGGKKLLQRMGGEKIREEAFLGKSCEVWKTQLLGSQLNWIWKGLSLKMEVVALGMTSYYLGQELKVGIEIPEEKVCLPKDAKSAFAGLK
ncbi:MAG: hypothetical protein AAFR61_15465 [Bacteroidota bacterium]